MAAIDTAYRQRSIAAMGRSYQGILEIEFCAQRRHLLRIFFFRQRFAGILFQLQLLRRRQFGALKHLRTDLAVVLGEYREGHRLGIIRQEEPVGFTAGVIDRGVAPVVIAFRAGGVAGLAVGGAGIGQAAVAGGAQLQHLVYRGQILALLDGALGAGDDFRRRKGVQGLEPQALGVVQRLGVREGRVELVMIAEFEQAEDFVERALLVIQRLVGVSATSPCP